MAAPDFATPTFHLVLEKQARDPEVVSPPRHQPHQVGQSIRVNKRLWELDHATPEDQFIGSRDVTPVWHRHRGRRR